MVTKIYTQISNNHTKTRNNKNIPNNSTIFAVIFAQITITPDVIVFTPRAVITEFFTAL